MLDEENGDTASAEALQEHGQRLFLGVTEPRRWLVEHDQDRVGCERPGDLDKPLLTESEATSGLQSLVPQPYVSERAQRELTHEGIILVKPQGSLEETRIGSQVRPKHDVLKHGHGGPQLHVLEGAR